MGGGWGSNPPPHPTGLPVFPKAPILGQKNLLRPFSRRTKFSLDVAVQPCPPGLPSAWMARCRGGAVLLSCGAHPCLPTYPRRGLWRPTCSCCALHGCVFCVGAGPCLRAMAALRHHLDPPQGLVLKAAHAKVHVHAKHGHIKMRTHTLAPPHPSFCTTSPQFLIRPLGECLGTWDGRKAGPSHSPNKKLEN